MSMKSKKITVLIPETSEVKDRFLFLEKAWYHTIASKCKLAMAHLVFLNGLMSNKKINVEQKSMSALSIIIHVWAITESCLWAMIDAAQVWWNKIQRELIRNKALSKKVIQSQKKIHEIDNNEVIIWWHKITKREWFSEKIVFNDLIELWSKAKLYPKDIKETLHSIRKVRNNIHYHTSDNFVYSNEEITSVFADVKKIIDFIEYYFKN